MKYYKAVVKVFENNEWKEKIVEYSTNKKPSNFVRYADNETVVADVDLKPEEPKTILDPFQIEKEIWNNESIWQRIKRAFRGR